MLKKLGLLLLVLLLVLVPAVSAESVTGTLGAASVNQTIHIPSGASSGSNFPINGLYANPYENVGIPASGVTWFSNIGNKFGTDAGAPPGASTTFTIRMSNTTTTTAGWHTYTTGRVVGTGTLGYQRVYNTAIPPVEQVGGYVWFTIDSWDQGNETGAQFLYMDYDPASVYNLTFKVTQGTPAPPSGFLILTTRHPSTTTISTHIADSVYGSSYIRDSTTYATYYATKPSGLGIAGNVTKGAFGDSYNSQAFVFDGVTNTILASETTYTGTTFPFTVLNPSIKIGIKNPMGTWYNSSVLFTTATATPTPTPTGTVNPYDPFGPIPAGKIRSMCQNTDSETDGAVHYSNMSIRDVENSSWSNVTSRFDGTWYIDTLPNHTISCYGSAPGYTSASRTGLPASQTMMYELFLFPGYVPPAAAGKVRLYVLVNDYQTGLPINGANVQVSGSGQTTVSSTTGKSGDISLEWVNLSTAYVTASKNGYTTGSRTVTTSASGPDTVRIELYRAMVTTAPTSTIPPGGVTPAVTVDPRSSTQKDSDMMEQIRTAGPQLISLAIAATCFGLLGLIMKSFKW